MRTRTTGNSGFALMMVMSVILSGTALFLGGSLGFLSGPEGFYFPGPDDWTGNVNISWIINVAFMIVCALGLQLLNRTYNFIANTDTIMGCAFLLLCGTNPLVSAMLNQSTILALMNIIILFILFDCFKIKKSMNELFLVGTMLAITSMFTYAAMVFVIGVIVMSIMLECFSFRGLMALFIGLAAPYIIVFGLGIVHPADFNVPAIETAFTYDFYANGHFALWLNVGLTILILTLCALYNAVGLYAGNTRRRRLCNCIMLLGWISVVGIVIDVNNIVAYLATLYLALASQLANLFALHQLKSQYTLVTVLSVVYICSYISMLGWF